LVKFVKVLLILVKFQKPQAVRKKKIVTMLRFCYLSLLICLGLVVACAGPPGQVSKNRPANGAIDIQGAGATFPYPLYSRWFSEYNRLKPQVQIDYQSIGSGGGIRQITQQTVDFGASDAPMNDTQLQGLPKPILHVPTVLGAVVITYNLPTVSGNLQLTPELATGIFLGEIQRWDDPRLKAVNPGIALPSQDIVVVHRSDGSGTTAVFVDYLSKVSPVWNEKVGRGTSVDWPVGLGGKGNEGVTGQIKNIEGTIGYVELVYAIQNKLPRAVLQNQAKQFIYPELASVTAAAAATADTIPDDLRVSITNAPGEKSYPISSYTYLLIYEENSDRLKSQILVNFLQWGLTTGQEIAGQMGYAPLPETLRTKVAQQIKRIKL
jgi:phosphate transport system substrate-binding protein